MHSLVYYERKQHGTKEFPAEYYYVDERHPRYRMSAHWHAEWELIRIQSGSFSLLVDEEEFAAKEGDILLLRGGMLHSGIPHRCVYECFVFDFHGLFRSAEPLKQALRPLYSMDISPQLFFPAAQHPAITRATDTLMKGCSAANGLSELIITGSLCALFAHILQERLYLPAPEAPRSPRLNRIKAVLRHIEEHYEKDLTLPALAEIAGMNPNYFCRVFQNITGQSPISYLMEYRIGQAAMLLSDDAMSITEIAAACGFNDHSYFTKIFKRIKKMTPAAYRKMQQQMI